MWKMLLWKKKVFIYFSFLTLYKLANNTKDFIFKTDTFAVHIMNNDNSTSQKEKERELVEKGLAIPDFENCKHILKKHYNISDDESIIVKNLQMNPLFNSTNNDTSISDSENFEFFSPVTKEKLDSNLCKHIKSTIKIPFKMAKRLKMKEYEEAAFYI